MNYIFLPLVCISRILEKLLSNKAPGPDEIPVYILKLCNEEIAPVLQIIFTQSFKDQNLPSDWLMANIVPIFKKGNRNLASNYWPTYIINIYLLQGYGTHNFSFHNESSGHV